ncbi:MAG: ECF transporter S component [Oscillospiraceae bacterium]|nr:ECF transporter S component [Oscillospiraceae bacterium]
MAEQKKFTVRDLAEIGVLAALVFVATYFLKIGPIPTPAGPTQFKMGNAVCLLGAMVFGKTKGGLAAGIGSAMFDLTQPAFVAGAPFTFAFFFAMSYVCGWVSKIGGNDGTVTKKNVFGAVCGACTYLVLHLGKSFITLLLEGSDASAALVACGTKFVTSGVDAVFAIVVSVLLAPVCKKALDRAYIGH